MMNRYKDMVYVLQENDYILAISEDLNMIYSYINQFKNYYIDDGCCSIISIDDYSKMNYILSRYQELILHPFTEELVLTEREISYYRNTFNELYYNFKIMMSQTLLNNSIMNLTPEEKKLNMDTFSMLYEKVDSYQSFLDSLNTEEVLKRYIKNPKDINRIDNQ